MDRTDKEIVNDALDEFGIDHDAFQFGDGDRFECPSCQRNSKSAHGLSLHYTKIHGGIVREAAAGDGTEYRDFLERVHTEQRVAPVAISNALSGAIAPTTIRKDCMTFGIYRPHPNSQTDSIMHMLDDMEVEDFDAKLASNSSGGDR